MPVYPSGSEFSPPVIFNSAPYVPPYVPPAPPPQVPNPGDVDPNTGMRWEPTTGQWLPPNFFSDLTGPGYEAPGGGGAPGVSYLPPAANALGTMPATPLVPTGPTSGGFFEIPDIFQGYFPQNVLPQLGNYLRGIGYTGTGNVGQFGERTYARPGGPGQFDFGMNDLMRLVSDDNSRRWLSWFFGERGLPSWSRQAYPGATP